MFSPRRPVPPRSHPVVPARGGRSSRRRLRDEPEGVQRVLLRRLPAPLPPLPADADAAARVRRASRRRRRRRPDAVEGGVRVEQAAHHLAVRAATGGDGAGEAAGAGATEAAEGAAHGARRRGDRCGGRQGAPAEHAVQPRGAPPGGACVWWICIRNTSCCNSPMVLPSGAPGVRGTNCKISPMRDNPKLRQFYWSFPRSADSAANKNDVI